MKKSVLFILLFTLMIGVVSALPYNLSSYYSCDNTDSANIFDDVGNVDLIPTVGSVSTVPAVFGDGCALPVGESYWSNPVQGVLSNVFSWCGYVNVSDTSLHTELSAIGFDSNGFYEADLGVINNELVIYDYYDSISPISVPYTYSNEVHFVCYGVDSINHNIALFLDGVLVASDDNESIFYNNSGDGYIAFVSDYVLHTGSAVIDEVSFFNSYLSESDVSSLNNTRWNGSDFISLSVPEEPYVPNQTNLDIQLYDSASQDLIDTNFNRIGTGYSPYYFYDSSYNSQGSLSQGFNGIVRKPKLDVRGMKVDLSYTGNTNQGRLILGENNYFAYENDDPNYGLGLFSTKGYTWGFDGLYLSTTGTYQGITKVDNTSLPIDGTYKTLEFYIDINDHVIGVLDGTLYLNYDNNGQYNTSSYTVYGFTSSRSEYSTKFHIKNIYDIEIEGECLNVYNTYTLQMNKNKNCVYIQTDNAIINGNGYTLTTPLVNASTYKNLTINNLIVNGNILMNGADNINSNNINIYNSTINGNVSAIGGYSTYVYQSHGGNIYVYNSSVNGYINTTGGYASSYGGNGGNVYLYDTMHNGDILAQGSNSGYAAGVGGNVYLYNSQTNNINNKGMYSQGYIQENIAVIYINNSQTNNILASGGDTYYGGQDGSTVYIYNSDVGDIDTSGGGGYAKSRGGNITLVQSTYGTLITTFGGWCSNPNDCNFVDAVNGTILLDGCVINTNSQLIWQCTSYTTCDYTQIKYCTQVFNANTCGISYTGDYSEFTSSCVCQESWSFYGYNPTVCPSNSLWAKVYLDNNLCQTYNNLPGDNGTLVSCVYTPPQYNQTVVTENNVTYTTTNLNNVTDINNVENFTIVSSNTVVQWTESVNLSNVTNLEDVVVKDSTFIAVNVEAVPSLNSTADVLLTIPAPISTACDDFILYYSSGYYTTGAQIISNGQVVATKNNIGGDCIDPTICTNVQCVNDKLLFTAQHFDGFSIGLGDIDAVDSCNSTRGSIFAAFALIALFIIVGAGLLIINLMKTDGFDSSVIIAAVIGFIAVAIVVFVGYIIIGQVSNGLCAL